MTDFQNRRTLMVDTQVRPSDVTKFPIIDALLDIPREEYVPDALRDAAYIGENIDLGEGRVLLEPRTLAKILDAADVQKTDVVLDLGCGLGYSTAVLAHMAEFVVAVEDDEARAEEAQQNLSAHGVDNAAVFAGPLAQGAAKNGPYDLVLLQGSVEEIPDDLTSQIKEGGRIVAIFAEGALGVVRVGRKIDGVMNWRMAFNATAPVLSGFEKAAAFAF
ncbi:protein-L-isoaspartate O-methyltransferase [Octadecabacter sp. 1_MG-2023]|uniref:protein-L-isoaspartate O-methyltransferase family protein n=1 Tax=unclassified Octadecabacter TaxID=196158 RepID=UPI001C07FE8B|nr:protein-L-isoaspartate O-methyltransferase [Octadecabacter sp. 1_MG-2023]MBU2992651.1 protein-L-isoaspartate O-methyltransferase [Octadecabacter sp. B2R22]MDO6733898.1 protein-L-isoaspartate O-methyltransferase [Octadecabacter sp. 1_MG-2023]